MQGLFSITNLLAVAVPALLIVVTIRARRQPLWAEAYRRLAKNRIAMLALAVICAYALVGILDSIAWKSSRMADPLSIVDRIFSSVPVERTYSAPFAHYTTSEVHPHRLMGRHLLGTDGSGRDILLWTLKGARTALLVGGLTTLISVPIGVMAGLLAGYYGRRADDGIQYVYTVVGSIPDVLLLIAILLVLGKGILNICIALSAAGWIGLCRLIRGETLKHRDREYVRAAKALGMSDGRILFRHILPNLLPIVIITITLGFSGLVLFEAILSYLQVGVPPNQGSWGNMIDASRLELARDPIIWWNLTSATVALFVLVLAFNVFGDALRDAIDPRLRSS
jgi:peptide/nickel transport system permease protein